MSTHESRSNAMCTRRRGICNDLKCGHRITTIEVQVADMRRMSDVIVVSKRTLETAFAALGALVSDSAGREAMLAMLPYAPSDQTDDDRQDD